MADSGASYGGEEKPLRTVAAAYGVSYETIRRIMLHFQEQRVQQEA